MLQGSSLSPTIFNFLINDLALELEAQQAGVLVHGKLVRCLLFADDTALVAATEQQLATLLGVCERWSKRAGMEFSPSKCVCFAPPPAQRSTPLRLYGQDLPSTERAPYLGFPFTALGIDFGALCQQRCDKAKGVIAMMRSIGLNATGWAPAAAARIYTVFIRPVMEYGVALRHPTWKQLAQYQQTQNLALRTIFSAPPNTSIAAMHRLLGIPLFAQRCKELNFLSACRFHNSEDASVVGVDIWRHAVQPERSAPPAASLPRATLAQNPLCLEFREQLLDHLANPLRRVSPRQREVPLSRQERRNCQIDALQQLEQDRDGIAASVLVQSDGRPHHLLTAATKVSRPNRVSITRWQLGLVAFHKPCVKCGSPLSREHAITCAELGARVERLVEAVPQDQHFGKTGLDVAINAAAKEGMELEQAQEVVDIIDRIEEVCGGRVRTEQGFWRPPEPDGMG